MSRQAFITALRSGLQGLPPSAVADIVADYEAHFADGMADGRSEFQVAQALGDPRRLARELRAEAGLKRWEEERNPSAAAGAVFAVLGLATFDILILVPVLLAVGGVLFGLFIAAIACFFAGGWVFVAGLFGNLEGFGGGPLQTALAGIGVMAGAVGAAAFLTLFVTWLVNVLVAFGRLHFRLLTPAAAA
jgi:uncharacterized membrane protein